MKTSSTLFSLIFVAVIGFILWAAAAPHDMHVMIHGDEVDGPVEVVVGLFAAGLGIAIALGVMLIVGSVLAVVFAGVSVAVVGALVLAGGSALLAVAPVLLVLLLPVWLIVKLLKPRRTEQQQAYDAKPAL